MFKVQFTATVVNNDTEETFTGWVDPRWSRYQLQSDSNDVSVYEYETLEEAEEAIESYIGAFEKTERGNYYAQDEDMNFESGEAWMYAAHVES